MNGAGPEGPSADTGRELFSAGFVTFSLLRETPPVLPLFTADQGLSPASASLSLSAATLALAVADALGRAPGRGREAEAD